MKGLFRNKVYFRRMIQSITLGITLMITVFSVILYFFIESLLLRIENDSNKNLMTQVQYNIEFIGQTIKSTVEHLYLNNDVGYIMNFGESDSDFEEGMIRMNLVWKSIKDANPFIHSIFIYNNNTHQFYSSFNGMLFKDESLVEYIRENEVIPRMTPIFRPIKSDSMTFGGTENVLSYFIYDTFDRDLGMKNCIVVNVKLQWLLDNINDINAKQTGQNQKDSNRIFLMDNTGKIVNADDGEPMVTDVKSGYEDYTSKNANSESNGFFTFLSGYEKYAVSYYRIDNVGATLFKVIPYREIYTYVYHFQKGMIIVFVTFLLLTILEALFISRRIYFPFDKMVKQIQVSNIKNAEPALDAKDELTFLSTVYNKNVEMLESYRKESRSHVNMLKTNILKSLLTVGYSQNNQELARVIQTNGIHLDTGSRYAVTLLHIDRLDEVMKNSTQNDVDLIKFAILNIGCEVISRYFQNDGIDVGKDMVCIIQCLKDYQAFSEQILTCLKEIQKHMLDYFGISVTATVSKPVDVMTDLPLAYSDALENTYYRYIYGRGAVLFSEHLEARHQLSSIQDAGKMEKRLHEAIMTGDVKKIEEELRTDFEVLSDMKYEEIVIAQLQLMRTMSQAVTELNRNRLNAVKINFNEVYRLPLHIETMDDLCNHLIALFTNAFKETPKMVETRYAILVDTVMGIIHEKYSQSSLCLDEIAADLNISSRQLSRVFKSATGKTVPEYINEVRLGKAAELLELGYLSVSEVALKAGIESDTYFYTVFKKKYGVTPKEYASAKTLREV